MVVLRHTTNLPMDVLPVTGYLCTAGGNSWVQLTPPLDASILVGVHLVSYIPADPFAPVQ